MEKKEMVDRILKRGVVDMVIQKSLEKKLNSKKPLRIKLGIDPTAPDLHLGHAVVLRKLRQFQDAGHTVILLFGGATAMIGDPTGRNETRPPLSAKQVSENAKQYIKQAGKILDIKKTEIRNNYDWISDLSMTDIIKLSSQKSVQQMLARRDFKERYENEKDISMSEFLYPLLQGYDSVILKCDVEIGGTDQLFNLLVGRDLQKKYESKVRQDILTVPLLEGIDGSEKMSKSLGNFIGIDEPPNEIFGKIMSLPDSLMMKYFELLTDESLEEITQLITQNPRNAKIHLAKCIITWLHDTDSAHQAEQDFITKFVKKEIPDDIPETCVKKGKSYSITELLTEKSNLVSSKSEARRLIGQNAVENVTQKKKVTNPNETFCFDEITVFKVGKRKWIAFCPQ
jgi:tyrosyl-tRNA synthetase